MQRSHRAAVDGKPARRHEDFRIGAGSDDDLADVDVRARDLDAGAGMGAARGIELADHHPADTGQKVGPVAVKLHRVEHRRKVRVGIGDLDRHPEGAQLVAGPSVAFLEDQRAADPVVEDPDQVGIVGKAEGPDMDAFDMNEVQRSVDDHVAAEAAAFDDADLGAAAVALSDDAVDPAQDAEFPKRGTSCRAHVDRRGIGHKIAAQAGCGGGGLRELEPEASDLAAIGHGQDEDARGRKVEVGRNGKAAPIPAAHAVGPAGGRQRHGIGDMDPSREQKVALRRVEGRLHLRRVVRRRRGCGAGRDDAPMFQMVGRDRIPSRLVGQRGGRAVAAIGIAAGDDLVSVRQGIDRGICDEGRAGCEGIAAKLRGNARHQIATQSPVPDVPFAM